MLAKTLLKSEYCNALSVPGQQYDRPELFLCHQTKNVKPIALCHTLQRIHSAKLKQHTTNLYRVVLFYERLISLCIVYYFLFMCRY